MKTLKTIVALTIIVFIPFGFMVWFRMHQSTGFATAELIMYPLLFGGVSILCIYGLKKFFLKEKLSDFNSGKGNFLTDMVWGIALTILYFLLMYLERATLSNILPFRSNPELLALMLDLRENKLLLILWFGPVLWIGIALYEELIRVFLLTGLWKFSKSIGWIILVVIISAAIIGLAHWSQGPYGIVTIGIKSLLAGLFYYKVRRFFPLILAHVLYDGIQVGMLLVTYPQ